MIENNIVYKVERLLSLLFFLMKYIIKIIRNIKFLRLKKLDLSLMRCYNFFQK